MKSSTSHHVIPGLTRNPSGYVFVIIFLLLLFTVGVFIFVSDNDKKLISLSPTFSTDFAYNNQTFLPAVAENKSVASDSSPGVVILPHHLLASPLIARGISALSGQSPETIIILSPNHANTGQCDILTSENSWDTPFGQVDINNEIQRELLDSRTVCIDDEGVRGEHGIAGLLPFIKYYLPNTKIIPLALKKDMDPKLFNIFTQNISKLSKKSIILVSIDFSHGLNQKESVKRDLITKNLILSQNYSEIANLSSEYLDSPLSLISALKIIEDNKSKPLFIAHSDSSEFNGSTQEVTSYYLIYGTSSKIPASSPTSSLRGTPWQSTSTIDKNTFTLLFGGDVMLGRTVNTRMLKYTDFSWPFLKISALLSQADLTMVNLESPIKSGCKPTDTGLVFCADPRSVQGLVAAGFDIVNLANNHIDNQGTEGINETLKILQNNNIIPIGALQTNSSPIIAIKGTKLSFLGFDDIQPVSSEVFSATEENIQSQVSEAKKIADLVIVTFHWGSEYSHHNARQEKLAHLAIDSGADIIIGHHPHWVQEYEEYKGKPIYYSLGNLVFDQMWSEETKKGLLVKFTYEGSRRINTEEIPIKIFDYGQPALIQ